MTQPGDLPDDQLSGLRPKWLLRHAEQLARRTGTTAVPRSVHARRSVSAAYYAVFHRVCVNAAWTAAPLGEDAVRWELCRVFQHREVETVARWVNGQANPGPTINGLVEVVRSCPELQKFALGFVQLKGLREDADYNHRKVFGRDVALNACRTARTLEDALVEVYGRPVWTTFTTLLLLKGTR